MRRTLVAAGLFLFFLSAGSASAQFTGNPFVYANADDQFLSCYSIASRSSYYCLNVSDFNDRQVCAGLADSSQDPCRSMTNRNLQLSCYGMAFAPNFPSNCRDITDVNLQLFCYGVSGWDPSFCANIPDTGTRLLCLAMSTRTSSYCSGISNPNDQQFCYGVADHDNSYCWNIE
jgi:hypothetical protein